MRFRNIALAALAMLIQATTAVAQPPARPNIALTIFDDQTLRATLFSFAPGNNQGRKLAESVDSLAMLSPNDQFIATFQKNAAGRDDLVYGPIGGPMITVSDENGFTGVVFSPDSRFLAYTGASADKREWSLSVIDLASNSKATYMGPLAVQPEALPAHRFFGAPRPVAWRADNQQLYVETFLPFEITITGEFRPELLAFDLSGMAFGSPAPLTLPPATALFKDPAQDAAAYLYRDAFSPDGSQMIYVFNDPNIPTPAPNPNQPGAAVLNAVGILDTATGEARVVANAAQGAFISFAGWIPDGKSIFFVSGNLNDSFLVPSPRLFVVEPETGQIAEGPLLNDQPELIPVVPTVCGETVFYLVNDTVTLRPTELYSIPLRDPLAKGTLLTSATIINLMGCTSQ